MGSLQLLSQLLQLDQILLGNLLDELLSVFAVAELLEFCNQFWLNAKFSDALLILLTQLVLFRALKGQQFALQLLKQLFVLHDVRQLNLAILQLLDNIVALLGLLIGLTVFLVPHQLLYLFLQKHLRILVRFDELSQLFNQLSIIFVKNIFHLEIFLFFLGF